MRPVLRRPAPERRGFTLFEMLVVVALVVLMMTILASIFTAATGSISTWRSHQDLDQRLRQIDGTLRHDLQGVTAPMNPPIDPKDNQGYFEYGENAFADLQGEDTDDYLAFTAKAPQGQPFSGRLVFPIRDPNTNLIVGYQPVAITSEFAEIIYFLRSGNLYRRVLLIAPERAGSLTAPATAWGGFALNGQAVSWQGMNDISARPAPFISASRTPIPNTLGDLTNRQNRYARPRFVDDFLDNSTAAAVPDGIADDQNLDGIPDYYPTLYPNIYNARNFVTGLPLTTEPMPANWRRGYDVQPFPYLYPFSYSKSDSRSDLGQIHSLDPSNTNPTYTNPPSPKTFNHAPLESGDSLAVPTNQATQFQSWWGFPQWKETISPNWTDPIQTVNTIQNYFQTPGLSYDSNNRILPIPLRIRTNSIGTRPATYVLQPFSDGLGSSEANNPNSFDYLPPRPPVPGFDPDAFWDDDLLMTGVRSFDVKAYDPFAKTVNPFPPPAIDNRGSGYYDLGYQSFYYPGTEASTPPVLLPTFAHEGRIPPLTTDFRSDPQWAPLFNQNIGDDGNQAGAVAVLRLRRVYDTWSTDYTNAPAVPFNPQFGPPFASPVYPSYPPPYPVGLRGIQIQIRVADPNNERVKVLTIRHDFSDKR